MKLQQAKEPSSSQTDKAASAPAGEFSKTTRPAFEQVKAPALSLPKGGGAMRSIDEKFSVNSANGTLSFGIPLPLSSDRGGAAPALSLQYNSGGGSSAFGLGWDVSYPAIKRKTDKGLPRYNDSDIFMYSGVEDLVPFLVKQNDGSWQPEERREPGFHIKRYRPRIEGSFSLIEHIVPDGASFSYWKVTTGQNMVTFYGRSAAYRVHDPAFPGRIFKWLPELSYDDKGHCTVFEFKEENLDHVTPSLHEKNRQNGTALFANKHLKRVCYGNRKAFYPDHAYNPALPADLFFLFEAVFDYGEHTANLATEDTGAKWSARSDPFSDYRAGFEIRSYRLCRRVLMFHCFEELGKDPCLVRSLDLSYETVGEVTYLSALTGKGYIRQATGQYTMLASPPMEFGYQRLEWNREIKTLPADSHVHAPVGLSGNYQWMDLYGEGLSGIFTEEANGWYYKSNEGDGVFSVALPVSPKPSLLGLNDRVLLLQDLEANGQKQVVVQQPGLKGYYQLTEDGQYEPFQSFQQMPDIDLNDPDVKLLDLNGDGQADLLIAEEQVFRWYGSKGKYGYDAPELTAKPADEEKGPAIVFTDSTQSIILADMSGDGLTDIVRIRNGEICYWPNLGYGKFGAKVTMSQSPVFDSDEQFNPSYLQMADISGTGATDIVYLGKGCCRAWLNQGGNGWSQVFEIAPFPETAQPGRLSVVDLLGHGTGCLVWSSPLPQQSTAPLLYIDLMNGRKPHVLNFYRNNSGKEVHIEYRASTGYYLDDKKAGHPWATRLPFPVQCVSKVITEDKVSGTRFTGAYKYHHGCYDYTEREFRGFAMVETTDTESYEDYRMHTTGLPAHTTEAAFYQPPVTTKTWYHTGLYLNGKHMAHQLQQEYYQHLSYSWTTADELPAGLSTPVLMEACRALKGMPLHQEVYSYDGGGLQDHPYSIAHHQYEVKLLQDRAGQPHAVLLAHERSSLTFHVERNPQDPRIVQQINVVIDEFGNVKESAGIVYGRKTQDASLSTAEDREQQSKHHVVYTKTDFTSAIITALAYRLPASYQTKVYELEIAPPATGFYTAKTIGALFSAATEKPFTATLAAGEKKKLAHTCSYFMKDDLSGSLPLGEAGSLMLPWEGYQLAFTPDLVTALYGDKVNEILLREEGKYVAVENDGNYWIASGRALPYPVSAIAPADVAFARENFYQPVVFEDNQGYLSKIFYDKYRLFPERVIDAGKNETQILACNYRTLSPCLLQDMNGNRSGARQDEQGRVTATFLMGKAGEKLGDAMDTDSMEASGKDQPGSRFSYEHRYHTSGGALPDRTVMQAREQHYYADTANATPVWHTVHTYSDGSGHEVLTKSQTAPGLAPERNAQGKLVFENGALKYKNTGDQLRWAANGRTIYNNKGNAVKQYEPYFDSTPEYNTEQELVSLGFTPVLYYDAAGRLVRTELADGTLTYSEFDAWTTKAYDQNDAVLQSRWYQERINGQRGEAGKRAAAQAAIHNQTPAVSYQDSLGRAFLTMAHNKALYTGETEVQESRLYTRTTFDITGNPLSVLDARSNVVARSSYNIIGVVCYSHSMDTGDKWQLKDTMQHDIRVWDNAEHVFTFMYDMLHRRIQVKVKEPDGEKMYEKITYGDTLQQGDPSENNLRGKVYHRYDTAGVAAMDRYDFKSNLLSSSNRLLQEYKAAPDWSGNPSLGKDTYIQAAEYDALNRPLKQIMPDGSIVTPEYDAGGRLKGVRAALQGKVVVSTFVNNIQYNAKGQREAIYYGNNTVTRYTYEPETYRLTQLLTTAGNGAQILQDLQYTYDAAANVTEILDNAQKTVFYGGQKVAAQSSFLYDALYQLIEATGREHGGQLAQGGTDNWDDGWCREQLQPNAAIQLRAYRQKYQYDAVGNMLEQRHIAGTGSWTRTFKYQGTNNRLLETNTSNQSYAYQYNEHGSMQTLPHLSVMEWNCKDELYHAGLGGGGHAWYMYNNEGSRVRKVIERPDGSLEERVYLGAFEVYRKADKNGITLERQTLHIMDDQQRIAMVETRTSGKDDAPAQLQRYQYNNHLQTSCLELDETARVISYEEYHPFGTTAYQAMSKDIKALAKRYRYTGKERDEESGLYYHGARYYAAWLCRWTAADPIGVKEGLNLYLYVHNRPVIKLDPNGNWDVDMHFLAVYWAGRMQGVSHAESLTGAVASQSLDDTGRDLDPRHDKSKSKDAPSLKASPKKRDRQLGNNSHSLNLTRKESEVVALMGIEKHDPFLLGLGLHTVGDYLPHGNLSGAITFGHQVGFTEDFTRSSPKGTVADHASKNPMKAITTFERFREMWSKYKGESFTRLSKENPNLQLVANYIFAENDDQLTKERTAYAGLEAIGVTQEEIVEVLEHFQSKEMRVEKINMIEGSIAGRETTDLAVKTWLAIKDNSAAFNAGALFKLKDEIKGIEKISTKEFEERRSRNYSAAVRYDPGRKTEMMYSPR